MKHQRVTIKGQLKTLNDMISANRTNKYLGAKIKKEQTELVAMQLGRMKKVEAPVFITCHWFFSSRHDFDNIASAKKFLLDGMVKAGKLPNDNQKWVHGFHGDYFVKVEKGKEKVVVEIEEG